MKVKNLPDDNNSKSIEELTQEANKIIEQLEKEDNLKNSLESYKKLINLNSLIEKEFQKKSKNIVKKMKEKISNVIKKNAKKT